MAVPTTYYNLLKPGTGETYDVNLLDTNYDKIDAELHNASLRSNGLGYFNKISSSSGAIGTTKTVVANIASFTFKAGRKYSLVWNCAFAGTVNGMYISAEAWTCSTADAANVTTGLTNIESATFDAALSGFGQNRAVLGYFNPTTDSTVQIKTTFQVVVGAGTATVSGYTLTIKDEGSQF